MTDEEREKRRTLALVVVTAAGVLTTPLPWHAAPSLLVLAALSTVHPIFGTVGMVMAWSPQVGPALWVAAIVCAVTTRASIGLARAVLALTAVLTLKQVSVAGVLPASTFVIPSLLATGGMAALAVASARGRVWPALVAGCIVMLAHLAYVLTTTGPAQIEALAAVRALPMLSGRLAETADPATLRAIVRADASADDAALRLGWRESLTLGWRPLRADGVVSEVARALEESGRGGEAVRLLRRYPRQGEVDARLALYERIQGEPVGWRGATLGLALPGEIRPSASLALPGFMAVEWTAYVPVRLQVVAVADDPVGEALGTLQLDGGQEAPFPTPPAFVDYGAVAAGPHRLTLRYRARMGPQPLLARVSLKIIRGVPLTESEPPSPTPP